MKNRLQKQIYHFSDNSYQIYYRDKTKRSLEFFDHGFYKRYYDNGIINCEGCMSYGLLMCIWKANQVNGTKLWIDSNKTSFRNGVRIQFNYYE